MKAVNVPPADGGPRQGKGRHGGPGERVARRAAPAARRSGVRHPPPPLPRRRARLRGHLRDPPRRCRKDVARPGRGDRLRGQPRSRRRARRGDRNRCRHLAGASRGPAVGDRRVRTAAPLLLGATSTWRSAFEGLFRLPGDRPPLLRITDVRVGGPSISTLIAGDGPEQVICLHGLGSNKASFFETISALTPEHTVHALDLPGFGSSEKPARGPYNAAWFASYVLGYLDAMAIDRPIWSATRWAAGWRWRSRSQHPERVRLREPAGPRRRLAAQPRARAPRAPAPTGARRDPPPDASRPGARDLLEPVRAARTGLTPPRPTSWPTSSARRTAPAPAAIAFFAALRNIYLDAPHGERGFWTRLAGLEPPALFIWGDSRPPGAGRLRPPRGRGPSRRRARRSSPTAATCPRSSSPTAPTRMIAELIAENPTAVPVAGRRRGSGPRARRLLGKVAALSTR